MPFPEIWGGLSSSFVTAACMEVMLPDFQGQLRKGRGASPGSQVTPSRNPAPYCEKPQLHGETMSTWSDPQCQPSLPSVPSQSKQSGGRRVSGKPAAEPSLDIWVSPSEAPNAPEQRIAISITSEFLTHRTYEHNKMVLNMCHSLLA